MEDGHCKTTEEVLNYFSTDQDKGLSLDQVKRNQEKYGLNGEYRIRIIISNNFLSYIHFVVSMHVLQCGTQTIIV